jgi:Flp pilus assembly pilin Flp
MMRGELRRNFFPPRKPLIRKKQVILRTRRQVRIELHSAGVGVSTRRLGAWRLRMKKFFCMLWSEDEGQDIAEYAVMLAVILVIVVGTIRLIGANANNVFSSVASSISQ